MNTDQIVKSWKDQDYVHALSAAERALVPENPVGLTELSDEDLMGVNGGNNTTIIVATIIITITVTL
jgi:mersacidin/lichenicidin family type 2 lantibiotic